MMLPQPRNRAEEVVDFVEQRIEQDALEAGDRLGTRASLRLETGVAKATINEAVKLLQARQRIISRPGPGGGLFVATPNPMVRLGRTLLTVRVEAATVTGAIAVREHLEPFVAAEAARHRNAADREELEEHLAAMRASTGDVGTFLRENWNLHARIAAISPNTVLRATYLGLYEFINNVSTINPQRNDADYLAQRLHVHENLVRAIATGDVAAAISAAELHKHSSRPT
jgi:DNA-binding FadR family transcriptional regulator